MIFEHYWSYTLSNRALVGPSYSFCFLSREFNSGVRALLSVVAQSEPSLVCIR